MILILWLPIKKCQSGYIHPQVMAILKALIMEKPGKDLFQDLMIRGILLPQSLWQKIRLLG